VLRTHEQLIVLLERLQSVNHHLHLKWLQCSTSLIAADS
jgi:hypothetical protein